MTLDDIDKSELILESYRIEGIQPSECRSIFLDWVLKLPAEIEQKAALKLLVATYGQPSPDHPMSAVLRDALGGSAKPARRGGRAARVQQ